MACCKICCGCSDCTEGGQGKCCCGGASGTCCATGEYCCSGVCQAEPCGCANTCETDTECSLCSPGYDRFGPITDDYWSNSYVCCPEGETYDTDTGICSGGTYSATAPTRNWHCCDGCCAECCPASGHCPEGEFCCDGECVSCGTSCGCESVGAILGVGDTFEPSEESLAAALRDENNSAAAAFVDTLEANGWDCVDVDESVYYVNQDGNWQVDLADVSAQCCGFIDDTAPGIGYGFYPCVPLP